MNALLSGKHIIYAGTGLGKTPLSVVWAHEKCKQTNKNKILVISTPSKALHTQDFQEAFTTFTDSLSLPTPPTLSLTSWHQLHKWVDAHRTDLADYVVIADELQRAKGTTTRMARSFLQITKHNPDWAGFTGTPGDSWKDYIAYFIATNHIPNKTAFMRRFATVQTFKGFPEIVGYRDEDTLKEWWSDISYAPDTSAVEAQLPKETNYTIKFPRPAHYNTIIKLRQKLLSDGTFAPDPEYDELIQNPSQLAHYLRQLCFTKQKQEWIKDFLTDLEEPCVIFYNYTQTAELITELAKKAGRTKVWRIDGSHHEIPSQSTISSKDIVLAQWQSGGEALNLQFLRYWVAAELTYSYSTYLQGKGRVMRIGQTRPVFYYKLVCKDSIDERALQALTTKHDFSVRNWLGENLML